MGPRQAAYAAIATTGDRRGAATVRRSAPRAARLLRTPSILVSRLGRSAGSLRRFPSLARRVLDECDDAAGHEPGGAHGFAGAGYLDDLDNAPPCRNLD